MNLDGTVTYTPMENFCGADSFGYTVSDGYGGEDSALVSLTVECVNDPPVAEDDAVATLEDTPVVVDVLANDSDVDGDPFTVDAVTQPAHGSAAINPDGTVTYTPEANYCGSDSFTYTVSDGNDGTDTAQVTVTVECVNDPPIARDDIGVYEGQPVIFIDVLANDEDPEGDSLEIVGVSQPSPCGSSYFTSTIVWFETCCPSCDPGPHTVTFTYTISDGRGGYATATITIQLPAGSIPTSVEPEP